MEELFKSRPFKTRNADEFDLSSILNLYVNPIIGLNTPFDYENTIVKGRMGSGKTMYLRANYAFYLYGIVPSLLDPESEVILPVFIRLSDFQHLQEPSEIYRAIIIKIIEELTSIYLHLEDQKRLAEIHQGFQYLTDDMYSAHRLSASMKQLAKLGSEEYVERVSNELGIKGGVKSKFIELSSEWKGTEFTEIKKKPNPGIKDIEECYKNLLEGQTGKIVLLIDEAGSLDRKFFQNDEGSAFFEILMNQFRTSSFMRTKIAVYPNSYSDMLTETRYGDAVRLEETIHTERGYLRYRRKIETLISNYLNPEPHNDVKYKAADIFSLNDNQYGDCLEQLLYASQGNMRRLIQLLDSSLNVTFRESPDNLMVTKEFVFEALKEHGEDIESLFNPQEKEFLENIISVCKTRGAYKFKFPNMSPVLYKYTSKSREYNLINIEELGTGRRGTVYSFDYAYSILRDLPTHYIKGTEKQNKERSLENGTWINRVAQISEELIEQASLPGKIEGEISFVHEDAGFIHCDTGNRYFFTDLSVIDSDKHKAKVIGKRVRFYPATFNDSRTASSVEILT